MPYKSDDIQFVVIAERNTLEPFPVECKFTESPPTGATYVHHDDEIPVSSDNCLASFLIGVLLDHI